MFKVIIVDDEPMIREGLRTLIPWKECGFQVVELAKNGRDAYEKYKEHTPDLMIVDIRMPEMDGVTLLEKIREENDTIHFIILSGYADFEYAKKAIGCRCDGYLLKPLDEDELIPLLEEIKQKCQHKKQVDYLIEVDYETVKEDIISKLVLGKERLKDLEDIDHPLYLELKSTIYQMLIIALNDNDEERVTDVKQILEGGNRGFVISRNKQLIILLKDDFLAKHRSDPAYTQLVNMIKSLELYASVGHTVHHLNDIHASYCMALQILERKFFYPKGKLLSSKLLLNNERICTFSVEDYVDQLYYAIDIVNRDACEKILNELFEELVIQNESELIVKKAIFQIYTNTLNKLLLSNSTMQSAIHPFLASAGDLFEMESIPCMKEYIGNKINIILTRLDNGETDVTLKKLIDLIHKDYHQSLRLETLAAVFNYNSAYLGKLFKSYTGEYFNTYLDKVRIENGKKLLEQGLKVYEVAEQIGYANVDYFHRKFKKYVGVSPSSFRKEG